MMLRKSGSRTAYNSYKGRWTYRLIPSIIEWAKRKHSQMNFFLIQLLTRGHGCYRAYLYKYGHDEACPECRNKSIFLLARDMLINEIARKRPDVNFRWQLKRSMCFCKESIDATKIGWERKVSRIGRHHSLNLHPPK